MRRAHRAWSATGGRRTALMGHRLGPGNTNPPPAGWVLGGTTPLPAPTQVHHPGYYPSPRTPACTTRLPALTARLRPTKEILGVDNALLDTRTLGYPYSWIPVLWDTRTPGIPVLLGYPLYRTPGIPVIPHSWIPVIPHSWIPVLLDTRTPGIPVLLGYPYSGTFW